MKTTDLDADGIVAAWNALYPVGTPVRYWRGIRGGEGRTGRTRSAAQLLGGHTPVVWVDTTSGALALTHVEVDLPRPVDPCDICRHPKASHGVRYVALHGDHEWRDPYAGRNTTSLPKRPEPEPVSRCDCGPTQFCPQCDPWHDQAPTASAPAVQADPDRPGRFSRILSATRRTAA